MKKIFFLGLLLATGIVNAQFRGQVYIDTNRNNKLDEEEKGFSNAVLSDGYEVVQTDAAGWFEMKTNPQSRFLFVTVPSGYKASKTHYLKVDKEQDQYNFGIVKDENQHAERLRLIQISDTETPLYGNWISNVRNYARHQDAALIMHTGDICYEAGMNFHAKQVNSELMRRPVYYAVGNHDLVKGEYGEKLFEDLFGPVYYSFDAGPVHVVVTPMAGGDYKPSYTQDQIIGWLKKDLSLKEKGKPVVFINHDFSVGKDFVMRGKTDSIDLKQYDLKAWLFGHWHNNFAQKVGQGGVHVISTGAPNKGGIDNSVGQFLVVDLDKNGVVNIKPIYTNLNNHIQIVSPQLASMNLFENNRLDLNANVYDSERSVKEVHAIIFDQKGNQISKSILQKQSDWNWRGNTPIKNPQSVNEYEILVEVIYANETKAYKKERFTLGEKSNQSHLQLVWSTNIKGNIWKSSPLIVDNLVITATIDDTNASEGKIVALDKKTGKQVWTYLTKSSVKNKLNHSNGLVLATDAVGTVYALDSKTGKLSWSKSLGNGTLPVYVTGSTVSKDVYYTGFGHYLSAIDVFTGNIIWQNKDWTGGQGMPGDMLIADGVLLTGSNWNSLFAHDITTGKLLWKRNDDGLRFRSGGVSYDGQKLFTTGLNGLFTLDLKTGVTLSKQLYENEFKVMASPLLIDDQVIMPTSLQGVKSFDRHTLGEKWKFLTGEALIYTSPYTTSDLNKEVSTVENSVVSVGNKLYFGGSDGHFYVLDHSGKLLDSVALGAPIFAEAHVADHYIYVADFSGNVNCFQIR